MSLARFWRVFGIFLGGYEPPPPNRPSVRHWSLVQRYRWQLNQESCRCSPNHLSRTACTLNCSHGRFENLRNFKVSVLRDRPSQSATYAWQLYTFASACFSSPSWILRSLVSQQWTSCLSSCLKVSTPSRTARGNAKATQTTDCLDFRPIEFRKCDGLFTRRWNLAANTSVNFVFLHFYGREPWPLTSVADHKQRCWARNLRIGEKW